MAFEDFLREEEDPLVLPHENFSSYFRGFYFPLTGYSPYVSECMISSSLSLSLSLFFF